MYFDEIRFAVGLLSLRFTILSFYRRTQYYLVCYAYTIVTTVFDFLRVGVDDMYAAVVCVDFELGKVWC